MNKITSSVMGRPVAAIEFEGEIYRKIYTGRWLYLENRRSPVGGNWVLADGRKIPLCVRKNWGGMAGDPKKFNTDINVF